MGIRSPNDPSGISAPIVGSMIPPTAYEVVKAVAERLDDISLIAGSLDEISENVRDSLLSGVTPKEFYDIVGDGSNETARHKLLAAAGRAQNVLKLQFRSDQILGLDEPFMYSGIRILDIDFNGARVFNRRATDTVLPGAQGSPYGVMFFSWYQNAWMVPNGDRFLTYAPPLQSGNILGTRIKSAKAGQRYLDTADGSPWPDEGGLNGTVEVGSGARQIGNNLIGFPVTNMLREFKRAKGRGNGSAINDRLYLTSPLRYSHDKDCPEYVQGTNWVGPARATLTDRPSSISRVPFSFPEFVRLANGRNRLDPALVGMNWVNAGNWTLGGARYCVVEGMDLEVAYATVAGIMFLLRNKFDYLEFDKVIDDVLSQDNTYGRVTSGFGVNHMTFLRDDFTGADQMTLAAVQGMDFIECKHYATAVTNGVPSRSAIGDYQGTGTRRIRVIRPELLMTHEVQDRWGEIVTMKKVVATVSANSPIAGQTVLKIARSVYDSEGANTRFSNVLQPGRTLTDEGGRPILEVVRGPYEDVQNDPGMVLIQGRTIGPMASGMTVCCSNKELFEVVDPVYVGEYAGRVTHPFGTEAYSFASYVPPLCKLRATGIIEDDWARIGSDVFPVSRDSAHGFVLGRPGRLRSFSLNVPRPATGSALLGLNLFFWDKTTVPLFTSLNLGLGQSRYADPRGYYTETGATSALASDSAVAWPTKPVVAIGTYGNWQALSKDAQAEWSAEFRFDWLWDVN